MKPAKSEQPYVPAYQLEDAYREANLIDDAGLEALCPSYLELSETGLRYRDETPLGRGSLKEVSRAYDTRSKRWVAIARIRKERGPEFYDQFVHEAWLTSSLNHPNIINIYDVGIDADGLPFFTMDLKGKSTFEDIAGPSFLLAARTPWPDRAGLLEVFGRICDAVAFAHSHGIIHLDLKPANIQVDEFGEVLVCDWGLGKVIGENEPGDEPSGVVPADDDGRRFDNMTLVGEIKGTLGFMAPEQVVAGGVKDERTDIFALGCILYTILTQVGALSGKTAEQLIEQTRKAEIVPPRSRFPSRRIPLPLEAIVLKATAREPRQRYGSVAALKGDLDRHLAGYVTGAEESGVGRRMLLFAKRNRIPLAAALLVFTVITVLSVQFVQRIDRQLEATREERKRVEQLQRRTRVLEERSVRQMEQTKASRIKLAAEIAQSANALKNLSIFDKPVGAVHRAMRLSETALTMDPECRVARFERFSLKCIQMNFKEAELLAPGIRGHQLDVFAEIAEAFSYYSFDETRRPSTRQMVEFLTECREVVSDRPALMERMVAYDSAIRGAVGNYGPVVEALIAYKNPNWTSRVFVHDAPDGTLYLGGAQPISMATKGGGSEMSYLRFLRLRSLRIRFEKPLDAFGLNGLGIEKLDIRQCPLVFKAPISLPDLKELHISAGGIDSAKLRRVILADGHFKIVVHPAGS